jgi:diguanylate cyclase (GGDEF)-like protein/PAS domain S-box-containing protein
VSMQDRRKTRKILERISECASTLSSFRRGVAVEFSTPIEPGVAGSSSTIREFTTFGLTGEALVQTQARLSNGTRFSGDQYLSELRLGKCFRFPSQHAVHITRLIAPSTRRFLMPHGWASGDCLVIPFWHGDRMLGHLLLDDPSTADMPSEQERLLLEEIADIASIAMQDASELEELNQEHGLLRFLADCAMAGLVVVQETQIRYANDQIVNILGFDKPYLVTLRPWWNFLHPDDRPLVWEAVPTLPDSATTIRAIRKDGRVAWLHMRVHSVLYTGDPATAFQFFDVTDRVKAEELLKERALRDPLTGFRNRGYFDDAIQMELQRSRRYKREFTLMMADLANFKLVNDRLGHQEGDRILAGIAEIIQNALRDSDWVVRYGGDEFLLVLPETGSSLDSLVKRLTENVETWCRSNCGSLPIGIDFGSATWSPEQPRSIPDLVREADAMLYRNKAKRRESQNRSVSASADSGGSDTR